MRVVQIAIKNDVVWKRKEAVYRCVCGHTETQAQMDKRHKNKNQIK